MIRAVAGVAAMAPYALADLSCPGAVSLAQNESAFGPSPAAIAAGRAALADAALYPDPDWGDLRAAIAGVHPVGAGQILCGAGSMELIGCLIRAFAGPGDTVLGTEYGYGFVRTASAQAGAAFVGAPEIGLTVSVDAILDALTPGTRIVFLCNPGNPTGTCIDNREILRLRASLPGDILLAVDQAYGEFADADDPAAPLFAGVGGGNLVVLRTFSKAYALAGARVGWGLFPAALAAEVRKLLNPNNIAAPAQAMAAAAMRDQAHMRAIVRRTARIRDRFADRARAIGLQVPVSRTNFVLLRFASAAAAQAADRRLRAGGLMLRTTGGALADCLRATICTEPLMERVIELLKEAADVRP